MCLYTNWHTKHGLVLLEADIPIREADCIKVTLFEESTAWKSFLSAYLTHLWCSFSPFL